MKFVIIIYFLLCLAFARHHRVNHDGFRHAKASVARSKVRSMMRTVSRNMRIRSDLRNMGMLGMAAPEDPADQTDSQYGVGYNEQAAANLWRLASITYCDKNAIVNFGCQDKSISNDKCIINKYDGQIAKDTIRVFDNKDEYYSRAYVAYDTKKLKVGVAFRGTEKSSGKNWQTNFNMQMSQPKEKNQACSNEAVVLSAKLLSAPNTETMQTLLQKCYVHQGFQSIHTDLLEKQQMEKYIIDLLNLKYTGTPIPVAVTGHSLGAAQATLYAFRMLKNCEEWKAKDGKPLCRLDDVYTFCSPRVGNEAFTEILNSVFKSKKIAFWRVVNGYDIVPMIPLQIQGFRHPGDLVYYRKLAQGQQEGGRSFALPKFCGKTPYDLTASSWNLFTTVQLQGRGYGEQDPHCSWEISLTQKSIADHSNLYANNEICDTINEKRTDRFSAYRKRFAKKHHRYNRYL